MHPLLEAEKEGTGHHMSEANEGLSRQVEALDQRLEALERENERMRSENAELKGEVAILKGSGTRREELGAPTDQEGHPDTQEGTLGPAERVSRRALLGKGAAAVAAATAAATLLIPPRQAKADTFPSVQSNSYVIAQAQVVAQTFVKGYRGVYGDMDLTGFAAVEGSHQGSSGYGVVGYGSGSGAGVLGRNASGVGVEGRDSRYGGKFEGGRAQLLLVPKESAGRPKSGAHTKGELYVDSAATMFVCTKSGTPGTWRKVTTTAAT